MEKKVSRSLGSGKPPVLPRPPHTHDNPLLRGAAVCPSIWVSGRCTSFAAAGSVHHICVHLCHMAPAMLPVYPLGTRSSEARPTLGARRRPTELVLPWPSPKSLVMDWSSHKITKLSKVLDCPKKDPWSLISPDFAYMS